MIDDSLLPTTAWERQERPRVSPATPGSWLLFTDRRQRWLQLADRLTDRGETVIAFPPAAAAVDPVIHEVAASGLPFRGVVIFATDDAADACAAIARVAQGLAAAALPTPPRLWVVTQDGEPLQAAAWGLTRTLAIEQRELRPTCILSGSDPAKLTPGLLDELLADAAEQAIALRADGRHVARLMPDGGIPGPPPRRE